MGFYPIKYILVRESIGTENYDNKFCENELTNYTYLTTLMAGRFFTMYYVCSLNTYLQTPENLFLWVKAQLMSNVPT